VEEKPHTGNSKTDSKASGAESEYKPTPKQRISDRVISKSCRLSSATRLVALAFASHLNGAARCWPTQELIAAETGLGLRTVERAVQDLCDGPTPMFARSTRRYGGRGWFYSFVNDPAAYAAARDAAQAKPPATQAGEYKKTATATPEPPATQAGEDKRAATTATKPSPPATEAGATRHTGG